MKILIIEGSQSPPSFINNLINGLLKNGVEVGLLGKLRHKNFVPQRPTGFTRLIVDYPSRRALRLMIDFFSLAVVKPRAFWKAIKSAGKHGAPGYKQKILDVILFAKIYAYNPDIVHFQWAAHIVKYREFITAGEYTCMVSLRGIHINVSPLVDKELQHTYKKLFPLIDRFHAVSAHIGKETEQYNRNAGRITVIYSMLPDQIFSYFEKEVNPVRKPLSVVSVGRFHWKKGYRYGIEAVYALKQKGIQVQYTIVAGSKAPEEDFYLVHRLGIGDQVKFIEQIDYQEIPSFMKKHSVLLLPSLEEGIANVVLEAMAVGLPVISSDAGGMAEVIVNKQTGWLVPVANSVAIAEAIVDYLNADEDLVLEIRKNAHAWVQENNNSDRQTHKFIKLYQEIVDK